MPLDLAALVLDVEQPLLALGQRGCELTTRSLLAVPDRFGLGILVGGRDVRRLQVDALPVAADRGESAATQSLDPDARGLPERAFQLVVGADRHVVLSDEVVDRLIDGEFPVVVAEAACR